MNIQKLITLFIALTVTGNLLHGSVTDDLNSTKQSLIAAKQQVTDASTQIQNTFKQIKSGVIDQTQDALNNIDKQAKGITDNINLVSGDAMKVATYVVGIGDLGDVLTWIKNNPIQKIKDTLTPIKDNFAKVNASIDPATDPEGIYKNFNDSLQGFDLALKNLQDVIDAINNL